MSECARELLCRNGSPKTTPSHPHPALLRQPAPAGKPQTPAASTVAIESPDEPDHRQAVRRLVDAQTRTAGVRCGCLAFGDSVSQTSPKDIDVSLGNTGPDETIKIRLLWGRGIGPAAPGLPQSPLASWTPQRWLLGRARHGTVHTHPAAATPLGARVPHHALRL
ncbi:hypothetical protein AAFF_G00213890 [Aldrovandia affinis]|uniref:Uncharacterized protein n=1 Tax=Aldrovandia affinis TaxID=143900 RepID=A0AAD7W5P5_9TELE|nr:hypothetical protein AAFF_G00213890 [Aldrovandia affinis]